MLAIQPKDALSRRTNTRMEINTIRFLPLWPPASSIPIYTNPEAVALTRTRGRRTWKLGSGQGTGGEDIPKPQTMTSTDAVEIKFKRGSKKRRQKLAKDEGDGAAVLNARSSNNAPKKWEEMSLPEKATELYMGEKGALFWLNKFAYASIFIVIGGWILFRFVGPALNLYQLDTPPLAPSSLFKGS